MRAALVDDAVLDHENLIGAPDRRQSVGDDERRPSSPQRPQAVLDERFALAVEARRRFIEDQDFRVGQNGARDGHALALAPGEPHAALAHDRLVAIREALDELRAVRDPAHTPDVVVTRTGLAVPNVVGECTVEQEVVLQDDT